MSYYRKYKGYKSKRERMETSKRNFNVIAIFATIALLVYIFMKRVAIWDWIQSFFYG